MTDSDDLLRGDGNRLEGRAEFEGRFRYRNHRGGQKNAAQFKDRYSKTMQKKYKTLHVTLLTLSYHSKTPLIYIKHNR